MVDKRVTRFAAVKTIRAKGTTTSKLNSLLEFLEKTFPSFSMVDMKTDCFPVTTRTSQDSWGSNEVVECIAYIQTVEFKVSKKEFCRDRDILNEFLEKQHK